MLPFPLLGIVGGVGLIIALFGHFYWLICWDLLLSIYQGFWTLGGTRVDYTDVMVGCMGMALVLRARLREGERFHIPYFKWWLLLGLFLSAAYLVAPQNQKNLTDPIRIGYQLYRYCWKPLIYYPLIVVLLRDPGKVERVFTCMIIGFDICAISAIRQGYAGMEAAPGPFGHGNAFASILVAPFMICFGRLFYSKSKPTLIFSVLSLGLMARALLFSESRAGMASIALSIGTFSALIFFTPSGRKRITQIAPFAILAPIALFIVRPDILYRPSVQHAMSVTDGTKASTMQWRMTERWPHFIALALEKPILGTGTAVDLSLGDAANTPHNGYIALAVRYGFPVCFLYIFFGFGAFYNGVMGFLKTKVTRLRIFAITIASPMTGMLAHNMIESTITAKDLLQNFFWIMIGLNILVRHSTEVMMTEDERREVARLRREREAKRWVNGWGVPALPDGRRPNMGDDWENDPPVGWSDGGDDDQRPKEEPRDGHGDPWAASPDDAYLPGDWATEARGGTGAVPRERHDFP